MGKNDSLGDRMKQYEAVPKHFLTRKIPAIIRVDGKAFHTFTKGMEKPFDMVLMTSMQQTMKCLCENIQGCVLGYTQSDEITLILTDYATITTDAWFGYNVQKMVSIAAATATLAFNVTFMRAASDPILAPEWLPYRDKIYTALFDARAFSLPKDEATNCLIWRQQDAIRNSIEAVGQANFSPKQLHGKSCKTILEMLLEEKHVDWNDFPLDCKHGSCCVKKLFREEMDDPKHPGEKIVVDRARWIIDREIPIFTEKRDYIESLL